VILLRVLHMIVATLVLVVDCVVIGSMGALAAVIPPRGDWTMRVGRLWARVMLLVGLVRVRIEGADQVPTDQPVVFMANHESWVDIPVLLAAIPVQFRFLAKKSLFALPFLGWAMSAAGFIPVDRKNRRNAVKSFQDAAERIRAGRSVLLFPEETRTRDGNLLPLQRGGFLIAIKAGIPIVPVGLDGARRYMPRGSYLLRPGVITVRFGAPLATANRPVTEKDELIDEFRQALELLRGNRDAAPGVPQSGGAAAEG
jgi:1-acyl-sn-glycerol-3-phosphate acyltransferase